MKLDHATDLFLSLTPDKVLQAVEAAGLRCNPVCYPLNSFENRVYEVELEDRSRIIAKFYRPLRWSREQILEEHRFLAELDRAEVPVCPVKPFPGGETLHQIDHIDYCLFERRGGRAPDELHDSLALRLGRLCARMHTVGAGMDATQRIHIDADTYVRANLKWMLQNEVIPGMCVDRYTAAANAIATLAESWMEGVAVHQIHGDFHLGNLLERDGLLNALDFDDSVIGPPVQDLWLVLPGRDPDSLRKRALFLDGYEELRSFDRRTLRLIEPLRGMRLIHYAAWLARRWHDPVFPVTWPHFGTEDYWSEATQDLEDVLHLAREDAPSDESLPPVAEEIEPELSNADYFWDWEE